MSKKFTGITSAGSAIPVYDKDAHSALQNKADVSALTAYQEKSAMTAYQPVGDYYSASNPSGFLTAVPADMATTGDIADLAQSISETYQPIGNYQPSGDYYSASNPSGFITGVDLTPYQEKSGMSAYQPSGDYQAAGDYLSASESANFYPMTGNPSGFLTEHQSLDGLMQTSGLEYDGDKISGYMGSAFAGGGEVPEGVMVESAVGYNAVNEISGYNGSAIAQYGAEKQWLVHDDTLVHAANSAQYALGVNLSAVAQLLGIDETVLYTTSSQETTYNLSGSLLNYNKFKVLFRYNDGYRVWEEFDGTTNIGNIPSPYLTTITGENTYTKLARFSADAAGSQIIRNNTLEIVNFTNKIFGNNIVWIQEVIGIGRKQ